MVAIIELMGDFKVNPDLLIDIINSPIYSYCKCISVVKDLSNIYVVFILPDRDFDLITVLLNKIHEVLVKEKLNITIAAGIFVNNIADLHKSFLKAKERIELKFFLGNKIVITKDNPYFQSRKNMDMSVLNDIISSMFEMNKEETRLIINRFFEEMTYDRNTSRKNIQCLCLIILSKLLDVIKKNTKLSDEEIANEYELWNTVLDLETLDDLKGFLSERVMYLFKYFESSEDMTEKTILKIKQVISEYFNEDLTIELIAKKVFLSKTYLCSIFKKNTGSTIGDFILEIRIQKAVEYFEKSKLSISEIGTRVGYSDQNYFTKVFKKYTGLIPSEYRKRYLKAND